MSRVIDLEEHRSRLAVKKGFRNWASHFRETFGPETHISHLSRKTLSFLAQGREKGTFFLYDLIMNLKGLGSGYQFNELSPREKISVVDQYIFLLDRIRYECMKRTGWIRSYPGEENTLVELVLEFNTLAPRLQAGVPVLSPDYPDYEDYAGMNTHDREVFIRKLIPRILELYPDEAGPP